MILRKSFRFPLKTLPGFLTEQQQQRKQFQTPSQHIKNKHKLCAAGKNGEILGRANQLKSWPNIIESGGYRCKISDKIMIVKPYLQN